MTNRPPQSVRSPSRRIARKDVAEWTVMVYLAGDNNLSAECVWALTEMQRGMSSNKVNVIAQFDPNDGLARTRRYEISSKGVVTAGSGKGKLTVTQAGAGKEGPKELDGFVRDFAEWNSRTGEVHFINESKKAHKLARQRQQANKQLLSFAEKMAKGEPLHNPLKPDELGGSKNDTDAASPVILYNFLSFGLEYYPARHYMIVLSGHSAGVEPSYLLRDDASGNYMTMKQLRAVFDQLHNDLTQSPSKDDRAQKIDILGLDTCLMSMAEVCCDLKDRVGIVIGSETYTPSSGWPYQDILAKLCAATEGVKGSAPLDRFGLAKLVVQEYVDFYKDYVTAGVSVALSALNVEKVGTLPRVVRKLTRLMTDELISEHPEISGKPEEIKRPFTDALVLAHWEAQSYNGEWYVDLVDFCECLSRRYPKKPFVDACKDLITFLAGKPNARDRDKFIVASQFRGPAYQYSNGVAIYFPWASVARYFWDFDFATRSGWGDFLAYYTNVTRRKFRVPEHPTVEEKKMIQDLERLGGNFLNYDRQAGGRRTSDKRTSDKGLGLDLALNRMASDKMASDKMASDKMASDKMASDKMASDKSGNPIHSMRNPPFISIDFDF